MTSREERGGIGERQGSCQGFACFGAGREVGGCRGRTMALPGAKPREFRFFFLLPPPKGDGPVEDGGVHCGGAGVF